MVDYKGTIKIKNELSETVKNTKKELEKESNMRNLLAIFMTLMMIILLLSKYMSKKTTIDKEDYIELLKYDNNFEKEAIEYLDDYYNYSIKDLLSDIDYLKDLQKVVTEKDWLLKRIKESENFKDLLNGNNFQEYLSLFEKDYIEDYFKEEIHNLKKELENINNFSIENVLSEKESFRIIKM